MRGFLLPCTLLSSRVGFRAWLSGARNDEARKAGLSGRLIREWVYPERAVV
jgi:hypothetical protein